MPRLTLRAPGIFLWPPMPRDTRDTLFTLALVAWIGLPLAVYLPPLCSAIGVGALIWRAALLLRARPLPSRRWLWLLLGICIAATYQSFHTLLGRDPGVTFVTLLLALKTLEMRARRDALVLFFLGFFTLLCQLLFSQGLFNAAATLIGLLGLLTALINSHMPLGYPPLLQAARQALRMVVWGIPITAALFVLFPRIAPLWSVPQDNQRARSGLSNAMEVGSVAQLALDSSVAMRIRFIGTPPVQGDLYFRGPVLSRFDGRTWHTSGTVDSAPASANAVEVFGEGVLYQVTLEASQQPWIPVLDATPRSPQMPTYVTQRGPDLQWQTDHAIDAPLRYDVHSYPRYRYGPLVWSPALRDALRLPPGYNPRTLEWAAELLRQPRYAHTDDATRVGAVIDLLSNGDYSYTLNPGLYGTHTADEFWFDRKQGFCEHIAAAFVIMVRALHIPARVVTGYQGGEINPVDGVWTVRQSDAHAWAEVWLPGQGWVRYDPTAVVAPQRTSGVERLQPAPGMFSHAVDSVSPTLLLQWRANWEAINYRWNLWVLTYSQESQLDLLRKFGWDSPRWQDLVQLLGALAAGVSLLAVAWTYWERLQHDPWLRLLNQARRRLRQAGLDFATHAPPRTLAETVLRQASPQQCDPHAISAWLLRLEAWRYAREGTATAASASGKATLGTLRKEFQQLRWPPRQPRQHSPKTS